MDDKETAEDYLDVIERPDTDPLKGTGSTVTREEYYRLTEKK